MHWKIERRNGKFLKEVITHGWCENALCKNKFRVCIHHTVMDCLKMNIKLLDFKTKQNFLCEKNYKYLYLKRGGNHLRKYFKIK